MSLMLEEISQQPEALARTIAEERAKVERLGEFLRARSPDLIVLVARGSSDNAALFGRYLLEVTTGIPVALAAPSVTTRPSGAYLVGSTCTYCTNSAWETKSMNIE